MDDYLVSYRPDRQSAPIVLGRYASPATAIAAACSHCEGWTAPPGAEVTVESADGLALLWWYPRLPAIVAAE